MRDNVEVKLVELRNELKAQKQASDLAWGQLAPTAETPKVIWSGDIDISKPLLTYNNLEGLMARFIARFTRADGQNLPPVVDFGVDFSVSPTGISIERQNGANVSVNNEKALLERDVSVGVITAKDNYTEAQIDFPFSNWTALKPAFYNTFGVQNIALSLSVAAYSPVPGTLSIRRVTSV